MDQINDKRLFAASCIALVLTAMTLAFISENMPQSGASDSQ